jgi:hypothetical protein
VGINRDFKGVWIPKDIWLAEDLTVMEKLFLVEIDSLDNDKGCFASNKHFSEFFGITKGRCTQIIKELEHKKLITISYERDGKQVTKRIIRVVNKLTRVDRKLNRGSKNIKQGYLENAQESNTSNSNTSNSIDQSSAQLTEDFEKLWDLYPNKQGKKKALTAYKKAIKEGTTNKQIQDGIVAYKKYLKREEWQKPAHGSTWFHNERWNDNYQLEDSSENKPKLSIDEQFREAGME